MGSEADEAQGPLVTGLEGRAESFQCSAESLAAAAHIRRSKPRRPELSSPVRAYAYLDLNASTDDRRMPVYLGTDMGV